MKRKNRVNVLIKINCQLININGYNNKLNYKFDNENKINKCKKIRRVQGQQTSTVIIKKTKDQKSN